MADFILREKEFRKLNEQLDQDFKRQTTSKIEKFHDKSIEQRKAPLGDRNRSEANTVNNSMNNDRFATYTKSKPHCTSWMKKHGGGDFISPPKSPTQTTTKKVTYGNGFNRNMAKTTVGATGPETYMNPTTSYRKQPGMRARPIADSHRSTATVVGANSTISTRKTTATTDIPVTINFRNANFSSSPSLDNLIKESLEKLEQASVEENSDLPSCSGSKVDRKSEISSQVLEYKNLDGKNVKKFVNTNGLIRFLKSKITLLEENQGQITKDMEHQKDAFETVNDRLRIMQQQRDKVVLKNTALSEQVDKLTAQVNEANRRSKEKSYDTLAQHKELETVKRELKQLKISHKSLEIRHSRTKEELESALKSEANFKNNERELKELFRREMDVKENEIKHLKKQRSDLFNAYKRQLHLIDNLRHQNICMEQAKMIDFCEKEFSKVLEWNVKP